MPPATSEGSKKYDTTEASTNAKVKLTLGSPNAAIVHSRFLKPNDQKLGGNQRSGCYGMARYSAHAMLASLNIEDTPIQYVPPRGPAIPFTVTYNQRDTYWTGASVSSNLGPKWTFNWLSYVADDPGNLPADVIVYVPGGGAESYSGFDSTSQSYAPDRQSQTVLVRTSTTSYEKRFPDGSKQVFTLTDGATSAPRRIFMTQWIDREGNAVTLGYDSSLRLKTISDALNQTTTLSYDLPSDSFKITKVTEPFSTARFANFDYDGSGRLTTITQTAETAISRRIEGGAYILHDVRPNEKEFSYRRNHL